MTRHRLPRLERPSQSAVALAAFTNGTTRSRYLTPFIPKSCHRIEGGANHHRRMEKTLQHEETTQCIGLTPAGTRNHRPNGSMAAHALTFKLDHLMGANHLRTIPMITPKSCYLGQTLIFNWKIGLPPCLIDFSKEFYHLNDKNWISTICFWYPVLFSLIIVFIFAHVFFKEIIQFVWQILLSKN